MEADFAQQPGKGRAMLLPVDKVPCSGNAKPSLPMVPLCVEHDVESVFGLHHTWVFASTRPFMPLLVIVGRKEARLAVPLEVKSVVREGKSEA